MTRPRRRRSDNVVAMHSRDQTTLPSQIDHDEIASRAYEIFCERGRDHGHDVDDWLLAERELRKAMRSSAA
jgi:hypothetical protein